MAPEKLKLTLRERLKIEKLVENKLKKKLEKKITSDLYKKLSKNALQKSKSSTVYIATKFKEHAATAIIAALGFLIALAWKDLIVKVVKESIAISSLEKYPYIAELYSAIIITIIAIIGITIISRWVKKPEDK
jgi:hypothetical protein